MPENKSYVPEIYRKVMVEVHTVPENCKWIDRKTAGK